MPLVQFHYRTFVPTTRCSAPVPRLGTQDLTGFARSVFFLVIGTTGSRVPCKSLTQDHAAYRPDAVRAGLQVSAHTCPGVSTTLGFDIDDTVSTGHQRFAFARLPGSYLTGSSPAFCRDAHHHRSLRQQLTVVWRQLLIVVSEGPSLISHTVPHLHRCWCVRDTRCWPNFSNTIIASRLGPAQPRATTWNGAAGRCHVNRQVGRGGPFWAS